MKVEIREIHYKTWEQNRCHEDYAPVINALKELGYDVHIFSNKSISLDGGNTYHYTSKGMKNHLDNISDHHLKSPIPFTPQEFTLNTDKILTFTEALYL